METLFCIPGIRTSDFPFPPKEWSAAVIMPCPECDHPMWMSEKKNKKAKDLESKKIEYRICCYHCLVPDIEEGNKPEFLDLLQEQ